MDLLALRRGRGKAARSQPGPAREEILLFLVADEIYGISVRCLRQVILPDGLRDIPGTQYDALGEAGYKDAKIPVVKMGALLGFPPPADASRRRILVVDAGGRRFGLMVDGVEDMVEVDPTGIDPLPGGVTLLDPRLFRGLFRRKEQIVLLMAEGGLAAMEDIEAYAAGGRGGG